MHVLKTLTHKMLDGLKSDDVKEVERAATVVYNEALKRERVQVKGKKKASMFILVAYRHI